MHIHPAVKAAQCVACQDVLYKNVYLFILGDQNVYDGLEHGLEIWQIGQGSLGS